MALKVPSAFFIEFYRMKIEFTLSKSGDKSALYASSPLHSLYNPKKEGYSFAKSVECDFSPRALILLEPALAYCAEPLKNRFPTASLFAIRFSHEFDEYNAPFSRVFYFEEGGLESKLLSALSEDELLSALIVPWPATQKCFPSESFGAWKALQGALKRTLSVLATKSHFQKLWAKNAIDFFCKTKRVASINASAATPIAICASGPSLEPLLPLLRANQKKVIVAALSSAILPLVSAGVTPDLILTTDGGYWARHHLFILKKYPSIKIALPPSAAFPFCAIASETKIDRGAQSKGSNITPTCYSEGDKKAEGACDNEGDTTLACYDKNNKENGGASDKIGDATPFARNKSNKETGGASNKKGDTTPIDYDKSSKKNGCASNKEGDKKIRVASDKKSDIILVGYDKSGKKAEGIYDKKGDATPTCYGEGDKKVEGAYVRGDSNAGGFSPTFVLLNYGDDILCIIQSIFERAAAIASVPSRANGTVAGTAMETFLKNTRSLIFFFGLDLCEYPDKASHAKPNALYAKEKFNRLSSEALFHAKAFCNKESLKVYEKWFEQFSGGGERLFRVGQAFQNHFQSIADIDKEAFLSIINKSGAKGGQEGGATGGQSNGATGKQVAYTDKSAFFTGEVIIGEKRHCKALDAVAQQIRLITEGEGEELFNAWLKEFFPLEYTKLLRLTDGEEKARAKKELLNANKAFTESLLGKLKAARGEGLG